MWGSDQAASVEIGGLKRLVDAIRDIELALGDGVKRIHESEIPSIRRLRGSAHVGESRQDGSLLVAMFVVVMSIVVLFALPLMFVAFFTALFATFFIARLMPWFNCDSPVAARCDDTQSNREHNTFNVFARVTSRM